MNFGAFVNIAKLVPVVVAAVRSIESLSSSQKGKAKQDAAVSMVSDLLPLVEGYVGKDLLHDPSVEKLLRNLIDAVVALENGVEAAKHLRDVGPTLAAPTAG